MNFFRDLDFMSKKRAVDSNHFVVKSNTLVEARYRLSLQESHVILWLLTQIKPEDEDLKLHSMKISDFAKMVGVKIENQYKELRKVTMNLIQRGLSIYEPETKEWLQVSWLSSARYRQRKGDVLLSFDPQLKPYLLQLKSQFTRINISDAIGFKSVYALRIFELLVQYETVGKREISINELRDYCGIGKDEYKQYVHIKTRLINRAKTEINAKTCYEIDYKEIKESPKVVGIDWSIKYKTHFEKNQREKAVIIEKEMRNTTIIIEQLLEYGFTKQAANRLIKNQEEGVIDNALKSVNLQVERGNVKNPKAMLQTAIKEKWHPERYAVKKRTAQSSLPFLRSYFTIIT